MAYWRPVMKTSCSSFEKISKTLVIDRTYYIDRIDLQINDISVKNDIVKVFNKISEPTTIKLTPRFTNLVPGRSTVSRIEIGYSIELIRPKRKHIAELAKLLLHSNYSISWLEIAYDLKTNSLSHANQLFDHFARRLVVPTLNKSATLKYTSETVATDTNSSASLFMGEYKNPQMFKMYIPNHERKPFKKNCIHTEFKLKGAEKIRAEGFYSLTDLAQFDPKEWYQKRLKFYAVNKKEIGKLIRLKLNKPASSERQCQKDFDTEYGDEKTLAHHLYHQDKKNRPHLIRCTYC